MSSNEHLRAAWAALLSGDLAERDRQIALCRDAINRERLQSAPIPLVQCDDGVYRIDPKKTN